MDSFEWKSCTKGATSVADFLLRAQQCSNSRTDKSLLSDPRKLLTITSAYLLTILMLRVLYGGRPATFAHGKSFVWTAGCHNIFLSFLSLVMNIGATLAATRVWKQEGPAATVCKLVDAEASGLDSQFQFWLYIFFLSKFYELLDTVLLILRGRPLTLLHVFHHATVIYNVYGWLEFDVAVAIYGMWFNTLVHVIMYAYYAAALLKVSFPSVLKKSITASQIIQFITGFLSLIPFLFLHLTGPGCKGVPGLAIAGVLNGSYLLMFVSFYKRTYSKKRKDARDAAGAPVPARKLE